MDRAVARIVTRAIRRGQKALRGLRLLSWATQWRRWARRWQSGEDRSWAAAWDAAWAAAWAAWAAGAAEARILEFRLQARDIHREIPEWPGEE